MTDQDRLPLLPLRDVVVFPHMAIPLFVGRENSITALNAAMAEDKKILLVAQRSAEIDEPGRDEVYDVATVASILQMLKLPDGTVKVLVEGSDRAHLGSFEEAEDGYFVAGWEAVTEPAGDQVESDALMRSAVTSFESYSKLNNKVSSDLLASLSSMDSAGRLADTMVGHLNLRLDERQEILEIADPAARLEHVVAKIEAEKEVLEVEKKIRSRVKEQMEKSQREYYLNEQMKAIQKELGEIDESGGNDLDELQQKIEKAGLPKAAREKVDAEFAKLKSMSPMAAEATVVRNYLDWMVDVPWKKRTRTKIDLDKAQQVLDTDHYGLERVKERIVENLAVQSRVKKIKGPILCLVGPPGVGKTSLGRSIAQATNRKFMRMSLGGVRDEAEIRGHRRTYIGSMPGKIVQNLTKVGVRNPLFLLDEVDKMAMDFRGDPASALLEVLDPEQNSTFADHYLEVDYDLSQVMFVCTANTLDIPPALLDRMEVIRLSGYTEDEKLNIADGHLLPKARSENGLTADELSISDNALTDIIRRYTREAGVRNLEREISTVCRKVVKQIIQSQGRDSVSVTNSNLQKYLGVPRHRYGQAEETDSVGKATGLAWTEVGGELLTLEAAAVPGTGKMENTGSLGDVMQESIQAARTFIRSRTEALGIDPEFMRNRDVHVHVPEGATPKDGPSAGTGMATAMISALTGIPVSASVAMTGEITLRGDVLPIGGLKEKLLAAHRGGIHTVLIPQENAKDLKEIPSNIKNKLDVQPVRHVDEVIETALVQQPAPLADGAPAAETKSVAGESEVRPH
ncbi:endopeptidase La [Salinisphaera sp. USBA-960]|uniref:endopeptidase La n=1 Tax=Salinisphaera orenii TaxID=856731 RepID=UPI000DBE570E|nr:endopeptidase La [Salifodinibacter halophilus]NNC25434.1 endopeptidase La [Salifodinibacter halophilus]